MIQKIVPPIILIVLLAGLYYPRCCLCMNLCKLVNKELKMSDILQSFLPVYNIHFSYYITTGKKLITGIITGFVWILLLVSGCIRLFMPDNILANILATVLLLVVPVVVYLFSLIVNSILMFYFDCKRYLIFNFLPVVTNYMIITGAKMYIYNSKHQLEGTFDAETIDEDEIEYEDN